jgi:hypothetical protein
MSVAEIMRRVLKPHAESFLVNLRAHGELGRSYLQPFRLYAHRVAPVPEPGLSPSDGGLSVRACNRESAPGLLDRARWIRRDYPELVAEYGWDLTRAEQVWRDCLFA